VVDFAAHTRDDLLSASGRLVESYGQLMEDQWAIAWRGNLIALCGLHSTVAHSVTTACHVTALLHGLVLHVSRSDECCGAAPMRSLMYARSSSQLVSGTDACSCAAGAVMSFSDDLSRVERCLAHDSRYVSMVSIARPDVIAGSRLLSLHAPHHGMLWQLLSPG